MNITATKRSCCLASLTLALHFSAACTLHAEGNAEEVPKKTPVTAYSDFTIVPPNLGPYLISGTDGDLYVRHLPLVGKFILSGKAISLDAKIHIDFNAELDATATGVAWFPTTITTTIDGVKTIIFEGQGTADEVNLVAVGKMALTGRGPYEGSKLELTFREIGPGDSNTFAFMGYWLPAPRR